MNEPTALETATVALDHARAANWRAVRETILAGRSSSMFDTAYACACTAVYAGNVHDSRRDVFGRPLVATLEQFPEVGERMQAAAERAVSSLEWCVRHLTRDIANVT